MTRSTLFRVLPLAASMLWAHAYLVESVPTKRAVLHRARAKIQLRFNERLDGLPLPLCFS